MDQETTIQVDRVTDIAAIVSTVGKQLSGDAKDVRPALAQGATAMRNSAFCAQLPGFGDTYASMVADLGAQVSAFAADLDRTAHDYALTDHTAHARILRAGR